MHSPDSQNARWWPFRRFAPLLALLLVAGGLLPTARAVVSDQTDTSLFGHPVFLPDSGATKSVKVGDLNSDGALDILLGNDGQPSQVYLNDRRGGFPTPFSLTSSGKTSSVALGDLNSDGALDILLGNNGQPSQVYLNDGKGGFPASSNLPDSSATKSLALGDFNGDSALDLAYLDNSLWFYRNNRQGGFPARVRIASNPSTSQSQRIAVGNFDDNQAPDILVDNYRILYRNDGTGSFTQPLTISLRCCQTDMGVGDFDADGVLDTVLGVGHPGGAVAVLLSSGEEVTFNNLVPVTSLAVGDLDGDGALDVVVGSTIQNGRVYLNDGTGHFPTFFQLAGTALPNSIDVADLNGDGALDIVFGNQGSSFVYLNKGAKRYSREGRLPATFYSSRAMPVGDLDRNGTLDIVSSAGLLFNDGKGNFSDPVSGDVSIDNGAAVGDLNGDGALDIVFGRSDATSGVSINDGRGGFARSVDLVGGGGTTSVAVGDLNGDGPLDIVLGKQALSQIYLNDGRGGFPTSRSLSGSGDTVQVALGDLSGDGLLDIVLGNKGSSKVYLNDGQGGFGAPMELRDDTGNTVGVGMGDLNGDGTLDIVLAHESAYGLASQIYLNDGQGSFSAPHYLPGDIGHATGVALGDLNGDGALDIVLSQDGYNYLPNQIYLNDGRGTFPNAIGLSNGRVMDGGTRGITLGDFDGDGILDVLTSDYLGYNKVSVREEPPSVLLSASHSFARLTNNPPTIAVIRPGLAANANFHSTPAILDGRTIPISYSLADRESDQVQAIRAFYSLDGGGSWRTAVPTQTVTTDLPTSPTGITRTFVWDTFASGFFGQSNSVVFRIVAIPSVKPGRFSVLGPFQRPYASATTFPFRIRGTQVRVVGAGVPTRPPPAPITNPRAKLYLPLVRTDSSVPSTVTNLGAEVYRIHGSLLGVRLGNTKGQPYRTDLQGYLGGRGEITVEDQLVALQPIAATTTYTVYNTSAAPKLTGLDTYTISSSGVQTLTVSTDKPLVLFNFKVSLEWDARSDPQFLNQLQFDLGRASELLYDWSNGQAALGDIAVYHAKQHWNDADIRIYATNHLRPNADPGGISTSGGQIRMGAVWTRYGDAGGTLGEDWPRALAHEIGHYAFGLNDNYLGLDPQGQLTSVRSCPGVMSDPYREDQSEFRSYVDWPLACASTIAHHETHLSDWENIIRVYPWLNQPRTPFKDILAGPNNLPLAVTKVRFLDPSTPSTALDTPLFFLTQGAARALPGSSARAFLFMCANSKVDNGVCPADQLHEMVDLGQPTLDQVLARGARVGDRVCVYELAAQRLGCENIRTDDTELILTKLDDWQPEVIITHNSAQSIKVEVRNLKTDLALMARLYPAGGTATDAQPLEPNPNGYATTFTLPAGALDGFVHIFANDTGVRREIVADYGLGGSGGFSRSHAPVLSPDGQVTLYIPEQTLPSGQFYTIQAATRIPSVPTWATVIGRAYRLTATGGATLANTSINFSYLGRDVPPGEEQWITVYYCPATCPADGSGWQPLITKRDNTNNQAIAATQGQGLYALMSSIEIPLVKGVNIVAYPAHTSRKVQEALASIAGRYTLVRGYNPVTQSWHPLGPDEKLQFGKGYEITMASAATWRLKGGSPAPTTSTAPTEAPELASAPAIYAGTVLPAPGWVPAPGMSVVARVNGRVCGQGGTLTDGTEVVYRVYVAMETGLPGCGAPARSVTFEVAGRAMATSAAWNNRQTVELPLGS